MIADLKAKEHIQMQLLKAQEMGTKKVENAKKNKELLDAIKESKRNSIVSVGDNIKAELMSSIQ